MEQKFQKLWLNINGADRMVVFEPAKDTLAAVLRRMGLTGTKIGCGTGMCGVCSVILNGKVIRSCNKRMKSIDPFSKIITIEGIGTPLNPHPLQRAFMSYGALQCGICTPGFIISSYQLLRENPDPTRSEVRQWFHDHKNFCRCTGYKQIVDAVMVAAAVMRGDAPESTLDFDVHADNNGRYYNSRMPRPTALAKVTGTLDYGEDASLKMPEGLLHAAIVQPRVTRHANILAIHTEEAEKMPGVVKVITGKDVKGTNMLDQFPASNSPITEPTREILVTKKIKRYGDIIALVVADTREHARAAAKKVTMDYEQLPEYLGAVDALAPDALSIQTGFPNTYRESANIKGRNSDEIIANSAYSVEGSFSVQHQPHLSLEGDIVLCYEDEDGMLTFQAKSQSIFGNHKLLGKTIGIPKEKVRIIQHGGVGASFGWSVDSTTQAMAGIACLATGHPISLVMSWEEHNHNAGKRTGAALNGILSCDKDGKLTALKYEVAANHGSYIEFSDTGNYTRVGGIYTIPSVRGFFQMFSSNNNHCTAWRGFGMPQVITFTEHLMDMLAEKAGIDPFEFRYRNIMRGSDRSVNGSTFENVEQIQKLMDMARPYYEELKATVKEQNTETEKHGVGVALTVFFPTMGTYDKAGASVEIRKGNQFFVHNTYHEMGQGGDICNMITMLESMKEMNVKPEDVHVDTNDSKYCPDSGISAQSRSFVMNCGAIDAACKKLVEAMRKEDGTFRTYDEMVAEGIPTLYEATYSITAKEKTVYLDNFGQGEHSPIPIYAVNIAHVAVDTTTGKTKTLAYRSWADCGVIGNYLGAEGQAYGGIVQSIGYALSEDYQDSKKYGNMMTCGLPDILETPEDLEVYWLEDFPREGTPYGSNGLSECFFAGQNYAILGGIYDAVGVRIYEQPALPAKVKEGIDKLARGEEITPPEKYYMGRDLDEVIEEYENKYIATYGNFEEGETALADYQ